MTRWRPQNASPRASVDALTVLPSNMFFNERRRLVDLVAKSRLPAVYPWRDFVDAGGLISYGLDVADLFRRAATYVDRILKGAKASDLPAEQPTKFDLAINLQTPSSGPPPRCRPPARRRGSGPGSGGGG